MRVLGPQGPEEGELSERSVCVLFYFSHDSHYEV